MTWAQFIWGLAVLASVLGAWYDTRAQILLARQEIAHLRSMYIGMEGRMSEHHAMRGHAGVMERVDGVEVRVGSLERRMDRFSQ